MNFEELRPSKHAAFLDSIFPCALIIAVLFFNACSRQPSANDEFVRLMNLGKSHYESSAADKAIEAYQKALALSPTHVDAHLNLANAYLLANQSDNAIKEAKEVMKLDASSAAAFYVAGCAHLRLRQFEDALKALQQAKDMDKTVNTVSYQLGRAHQEMGHWEDAIREFSEVVQFEEDHPAANYNLSQALIRIGRKEEANQALEKHRQILAQKPQTSTDISTFEKCVYTQPRAPFVLEQPDRNGVKVTFADVTEAAFGAAAKNFHGPFGVLDINLRGQNDLFVREGEGSFRLLLNSNGHFQAQGETIPAIAGAKYMRCLVGDMNNDRFEDVVMLSDKGLHLFRFATNGGVNEVTTFANLKSETAAEGVLADLDFTGKLDLLLVTPAQKNVRVLRNLGQPYFMDITATSGVPTTVTGISQLVLEDWNDDDLQDLLVVREGQPLQLFVKQRGGALVATNTPADWPAAKRIAVGDLNNDLRSDLVIATTDKLECVFNGLTEHIVIPLGSFSPTSLTLVDFDNDGWLDIVAAGEGMRAWRNLGREGFREVTAGLGLAQLVKGKVESVAAADFDNDCATDLLLSVEGRGLQLLRNVGGNANRQLKLKLFGNRSNASGIGMRVEVVAGKWRTIRTVSQLPIEIGVGPHPQLDSVIVRWSNLAPPIVDYKIEQCAALSVWELSLPEGSCPYLYAWDGHKFRFVTDLLGAAPLGLRLTDTRFIDADAEELVWIGDETLFQPREGKYILQITEELREVLYLDEAKLVVVDHAPGTEVHPTGKLMPGKPWPPKELMTLHRRQPLRQATRLDGVDVTSALTENDRQVVSPLKLRIPQLRGLAEPHGVVLDFGSLAVERPLVLALTGWLRFGGGMANVGASHNPDLPFPFPQLEVEVGDGKWKPVDVVVGAPAGKTKTIVVDLTGKLPPHSRRLRLMTAFEIHWDRIALFEKQEGAETRIARFPAGTTDLHWRGFSEFADLPWSVPLTPEYDKVRQFPYWRITPTGWCTRYGEVNKLIDQKDNALALLNGGDELTLTFESSQLPPKPPGMVREFFLYSVGWDKDADFHVERGWSVDPLPFHGMDDQLYGRQERPAFDNDGWMEKYNTRWVGPKTFSRAKK